MDNPFKAGDFVYKNHVFDGTPNGGYPDKRKEFRISKIEDFCPIDGTKVKNGVCHLIPGTWSFFWNLSLSRLDNGSPLIDLKQLKNI